jgi:hypothetical protein
VIPTGVAFEFRQRFALFASFAIHLTACDHGAVFEVERVADLLAVVFRSRQTATFEDQLYVAVVVDADLRVRRLPLIDIADPTADAHDALRQRGAWDHPPCDVGLMDALVAVVAVAEVPEPVPVVMDEIAVVRLFRSRAEPEVEVDFGRGRRRRFHADALPRLVAEPTRDGQLAEGAGLNLRGEFGPRLRGSILRAVLHDPIVFPRRVDRGPTFVHVVAARLLDVHILAGLARPDGHERVPVVRRRDRNGIDVLVVERLANVLDLLRLVGPFLLVDLREMLGVGPRVGIDEVHQLDVVHLQIGVGMGMAATVQPGDGDAHPIVGTDHTARRFGAADHEGGAERSGNRSLEKVATPGERQRRL